MTAIVFSKIMAIFVSTLFDTFYNVFLVIYKNIGGYEPKKQLLDFLCIKNRNGLVPYRGRSPPGLFFIFKIYEMEDKPMAKPGRIPDFRKLYPEASEEVIEVLRQTERKMQYQEYDLKMEQIVVDQEEQIVDIIPSREDSLERLMDKEVQFQEASITVEEVILQRLEVQRLHRALSLLSEDERYLIEQIYFEEKTEREMAKELGVYHNAVHKKKQLILKKLKNFLKNF